MYGKILVVDPIVTNRIVLNVKLSAAHYSVLQADSPSECIETIINCMPNLVLISDSIQDTTLEELTHKIRQIPNTENMLIVVQSNNFATKEHLKLMELQPFAIDAILPSNLKTNYLLSRIRSLLRFQSTKAEWKLHEETYRALNFEPHANNDRFDPSVMLVSEDDQLLDYWRSEFQKHKCLSTQGLSVEEALSTIGRAQSEEVPDIVVLMFQPETSQQMLNFLAVLKAHSVTRHCFILALQTFDEQDLSTQILDMGANDIIENNCSSRELALRIRILLEHKLKNDQMRTTMRDGLTAAVYDPLTNLHNRRFALSHFEKTNRNAQQSGSPYCVMIADIDFFKQINDEHGHSVGDIVLSQLGKTLRDCTRSTDLVARIGGEEFMFIFPNVSGQDAEKIAQRICQKVDQTPIHIGKGKGTINVTISIGISIINQPDTCTKTTGQIFDEADAALYLAKKRGRNCIKIGKSAA